MSKRRTSGTGSIFPWKKKNPKTGELEQVGWRADVDLGIVDGKRKREMRYVGMDRKKELVAWLNATNGKKEAGTLPKAGAMSVEQWLAHWLRSMESSVRARTLEHYEGIVRLHLAPAIGKRPLAKLTPSDVETMLAGLIKKGQSARSAHHVRAVLRNALKGAERDGLVSRNAAALARPPRVAKTEMATLTPDQVKAFLAAIQGDRLEALYITTLGLGLREGEVLGVRWSDVDLDAGVLRVSHALQWIRPTGERAAAPHLVEPKSSTSRRTLTLPKPVLDALRSHRKAWVDEQLHGKQPANSWDLVFVGPVGEALNPRWVWSDFRRKLAAAQLPAIRFHDLRHSTASLLLLAGVPARMVQEILGHSSISLTLGTYSHVLPGLREQAVAAQAAILGG